MYTLSINQSNVSIKLMKHDFVIPEIEVTSQLIDLRLIDWRYCFLQLWMKVKKNKHCLQYSSRIVLYPLQVGCHIKSRTKHQWVAEVNS